MTITTPSIPRAERPPLADLRRVRPFRLRALGGRAAAEGDGNILDGYAAVFDEWTTIDSWEGRFKESIAPGSMKRSFREMPPVIQFDHGSHPLIGSIPIARLDSIAEESDPTDAPRGGAHVIGTIHDNWLMQPVRDAIASRSIKGMSFRFEVVREEWRDHTGRKITDPEELHQLLRRSWLEDVPDDELLQRTLRELKVPELGPVVFPAYRGTSVGVRSQVTIDLARLDDPEQRSILARAVLLAEQAAAESGDDAQRGASSDEVAAEHPSTPDDATQRGASSDEVAAEHLAESPDAQRGASSDEVAAEHPSSVTRLDVRHDLDEIDEIWRTTNDLKGRYVR